MANSLTQLNTLTGCFPGATGLPADGATTLPASHVDDYNNTDGYIAIPINSIAYTGGEPNRFIVDDAGVNPVLTLGVGDGAGTCTGDFRTFARGMHESWARYTAHTLTGNNAIAKWGETSGNYVVFNADTLSKRYTSSIYYAVGFGLPTSTDYS